MDATSLYIVRELLWASLATISITVGALVLAVLVGFFLAIVRLWAPAWVRYIALTYIEILRNTPVLVQLFVLYFGLAQVGFQMAPLAAAIIGLGLNGSALLAEVFYSSIKAVDRGQEEAGLAIGLTPAKTLFYVILPQALKIALPSVGSYMIALMKDTSLASAVAAPEIAFRARMLVSETYLSTQIYLLVAAIYFVLSFPVARAVVKMENRLMKGNSNNA
jgi:His/Glu/Gln/Arg/opine family amino acid ABC transporter permease subunit